ncbi:hypothetical protein B0H19DRAFT_1083230 [Mycena capillaripes]|nr:hypothetical protein B0H19DRAFT_1083230 [Mycena capillaripes]
MDIYWHQVRRGYRPENTTCEGKLLFIYDSHGRLHIQYGNTSLQRPLFAEAVSRCEHYSKTVSRDHFCDDSIGSATGAYDLKYIQAVLNEDQDEVTIIEEAAFDLGYGPLTESFDHRYESGNLKQSLMQRLECSVKFRVFEPLEEYRHACPYILITSSGLHTHPIPLPTKTPPAIRT